jgi:ribosome-associated protein
MFGPKFKVPEQELEFSFVRSSGPGGQNVNKVNSKALLRWSIRDSKAVSETLRPILLEKLQGKLNSEGEILISSDVHRDQIRNREDCIQRLQTMLDQALFKPKARKKTKQSWSSQKRDETSKKKHSEKKKLRKIDY